MSGNVYVTGISGQIGTHLGRYLRERGYRVTGVDTRQAAAGACDDFQKIDILSAGLLAESLRSREYSSVIHLAAIVAPTEEPASRVFDVNVLGTLNVVRAAMAATSGSNPRFIFMSSESVLGFSFSGLSLKPSIVPITEEHPLRATDPYGSSKLLGERLAALYHDVTGAPAFSLRPPWVWLPEKYDLYRSLLENPGEWAHSLWAYIVIDDLCAAVERAMVCQAQGHHALFLTANDVGTAASASDLLRQYYRFEGPFRAGFSQSDSVISSRAAKGLLGWEPKWNWRSWLDYIAPKLSTPHEQKPFIERHS